jgi:hypothetical protein
MSKPSRLVVQRQTLAPPDRSIAPTLSIHGPLEAGELLGIDCATCGSIAVDTAFFIYFIEENPRFLPLIAPLFREADQDKRERVTSAMTLLEVLVVPCLAMASLFPRAP